MMAIVLCTIYGYVVGDIGAAVASAGVIMLGASAALGKVSWQMAITIAVGISITFGAAGIAFLFGIVSPCP